MKLSHTNVSLASFQMPNVELFYLDPYNNTFGENNWFIVFFVITLCICSMCSIFLSFGIWMFVKYGINPDNRRLLDMLISFGMIIFIITLVPITILMVHRNVFGPLQNETIFSGLLLIQTFGKMTIMMLTIVGVFVWYMTEIVFKNQCEMDEVGMAECIKFFIVSLSAGLTFLISSVGYGYHQVCIRYIGLPLDTPEYLIHIK